MNIEERINAFVKLGDFINQLTEEEIDELHLQAVGHNNWFTRESIVSSLKGIEVYLTGEALNKWVSKYQFTSNGTKMVGVIMAGNIPMVGFHDLLSVLISGHHLHAKLSSQDPFLLKFLSEKIIEIEPRFEENIQFVERMNDVEALIATGSDNSARYFEYYFSKIPHVIRKNRSSCAVLTGKESTEEINKLGNDILQYYGLGCRNVSKLYVPVDFDFIPFLDALQDYAPVLDHHKYSNNYDYNKSIYLVNKVPHLDTGFLLLHESEQVVSPISVLYYEYYKDENDLEQKLSQQSEKLQCIISKGAVKESIKIGEAQNPSLWDYADGVDTLAFLQELS